MLESKGHEQNKQDIEKSKAYDGGPLFGPVHIEILVGEFEDRRNAESVDQNRREQDKVIVKVNHHQIAEHVVIGPTQDAQTTE